MTRCRNRLTSGKLQTKRYLYPRSTWLRESAVRCAGIGKGQYRAMKRSKINVALKEMEAMIRKHSFALPPFCGFTPKDWEHKGHAYDEIRDNMLGWDITDYGLGRFDEVGFSLITLRNGNLKNEKYTKTYAEKLLYIKEGQMAPMHFHWDKMEDIINRGGGNVLIRVYNSTEDGQFADTDVTVNCDGKEFTVPAGKKPYVIMVVGVNGVGKTTTIGKLAYQFKKANKSVYLGAADTFRAAAVEQLDIWGTRVGVPVIKQKMGSDPASVAFDTLSSAVANNADVVIIDTAGRLHNKVNLMNELTKIKNVMKKVIPDAPHEVLLVLDGSTGQNAFEQAKQFTLATEVTSMAITKLDGTAKGGIIIPIKEELGIPVKLVGVGEKIDDLQPFVPRDYVEALFE